MRDRKVGFKGTVTLCGTIGASEFWGAQHAIKELSDLKGLFGSVWDSTGKSGSWISVHLIVVYVEY